MLYPNVRGGFFLSVFPAASSPIYKGNSYLKHRLKSAREPYLVHKTETPNGKRLIIIECDKRFFIGDGT